MIIKLFVLVLVTGIKDVDSFCQIRISKPSTNVYLGISDKGTPIVSGQPVEWTIETNFIPFGEEHSALREKSLYLAVMDDTVTTVNGTTLNRWIRAFIIKDMGNFKFTMSVERLKKLGENSKIALVNNSVTLSDDPSQSFWKAEINNSTARDCYKVFNTSIPNPPPTRLPTTTTTTSSTTTTTTSTTNQTTTTNAAETSTSTNHYLSTNSTTLTTAKATSNSKSPSTTTSSTTPKSLTTTKKKKEIGSIIDGICFHHATGRHCTSNQTDFQTIIEGQNDILDDKMREGKGTMGTVMDFAENVEEFGLRIADLLMDGVSEIKTSNTMNMKMSRQVLPFRLEFSNMHATENGIEIKGNVKENVTVFGVRYKALHKQITENITMKDSKRQGKLSKYKLNSQMIAARLHRNISSKLIVTVKLRHTIQMDRNKTVCAFWNSSERQWSTEGCMKLDVLSTDQQTSCLCSHLTNFAILTFVSDVQMSENHERLLSSITYFCSGISILFLAVGVLLFSIILSGSKKRTKFVIHLNLMIALLLSQLIFVGGVEAIYNKIACLSVAYLLHYFLLVSFAWMLIEGIYLYFSVVSVFSDPKKYIRWFFVLAWGIPVFIVGSTGLATGDSYIGPRYCWLSTENYIVWSFIGPVLFVIMINTVLLIMVLREIVKLHQSGGLARDVRTGFRTMFILLPVLGITWVFGTLSFTSEIIFFQYLFAVFNSLQGFLVTLFHCFLNSEVRSAIKHRFNVLFHSKNLTKPSLQFNSSVMLNRTHRYEFSTQNNHSSSVRSVPVEGQRYSMSSSNETLFRLQRGSLNTDCIFLTQTSPAQKVT